MPLDKKKVIKLVDLLLHQIASPKNQPYDLKIFSVFFPLYRGHSKVIHKIIRFMSAFGNFRTTVQRNKVILFKYFEEDCLIQI